MSTDEPAGPQRRLIAPLKRVELLPSVLPIPHERGRAWWWRFIVGLPGWATLQRLRRQRGTSPLHLPPDSDLRDL